MVENSLQTVEPRGDPADIVPYAAQTFRLVRLRGSLSMPAAIAVPDGADTWSAIDQHGSGGDLSREPRAQCELRR